MKTNKEFKVTEEVLKSKVKEIVDEILKGQAEEKIEAATEEVQKSENVDAQAAEVAKTEEVEKAMKKSDDEDEDDEDEKEEKNEKDPKKKKDSKKNDKDKDDKKPAFMKKSEDEIGELSEEEQDLIKAWRASAGEPITEEVAKSEDKSEDLKKALETEKTEKEELKKAITQQSDLIKSLTDKVEKMAAQPAYDKRSVSTLEVIEKTENENSQSVTKPQVLNALLELQRVGQATSFDVSKYESTNQLSKSLQETVKQHITKKVQ